MTNLFGTIKRIDLAFGKTAAGICQTGGRDGRRSCFRRSRESSGSIAIWRLTALKLGNKEGRRARRFSNRDKPSVDLEKLPLLQLWHEDGGHFITLPLVYTESPATGKHNLGMYRMQRYDKTTTGMHWQIGKGGGFHYFEAEQRERAACR